MRDQRMFVWNVPRPYKREMSKLVFKKYLKSFKTGTLVHLCTISTYALYTLCKCPVQWHNFYIPTIERVHMGGLTMFQCHA